MARENRRPVLREQRLERLAVMGTIPPGLHGTPFRNGSDPRHPSPDQHRFGRGLVRALSEVRITYRNRGVLAAHRQDRGGWLAAPEEGLAPAGPAADGPASMVLLPFRVPEGFHDAVMGAGA